MRSVYVLYNIIDTRPKYQLKSHLLSYNLKYFFQQHSLMKNSPFTSVLYIYLRSICISEQHSSTPQI